MATGALSTGLPPLDRLVSGRATTLVTSPLKEPCTICGKDGSQISYSHPTSQVVRVDAAFNAMWKRERVTGEAEK